MKNFKTKLFGVSLFVLALGVVSCNRDFSKVIPTNPDSNPNITYKTPKVLYIIADGARGNSVLTTLGNSGMPNLLSLVPNSIYTFSSLADPTNTDATNWADLITGVKKEKHNVLTEDFAGNKLADYPTIFTRIKSVKPSMRIAAFSASAAFKANLTSGTDVSESFASDEAVKTRMVDFIKTDTASLIVGEFAEIGIAGRAPGSGFDVQYAPYSDAIKAFDTRLGAIITSLKSRANYAKENWLIIVTSNRGGQYTLLPSENDKTIFSNTNINTFAVIYNEKYRPTFIPKPFVGNVYTGTAPRFLGDPEKAVGLTSTTVSPAFNFGDSSFSVSVKIKKHKNPSNISRGDYYYQYPGVLGKRSQTTWGDQAGGAGWDFCVIQNTWRFFIGGGTGGAFPRGYEFKGVDFSGDTWHDLTAVVERKADGSKVVRIYTDGQPGISNQGFSLTNPSTAEYKLNGTFNADNTSPVRVGYSTGEIDGTFGKIDVELKEFKIFRAALPDNVVRQYACDQSINRSHPYYDLLAGYWPMNEGSGNKLLDKGPYGADFTLTGGYTWNPFSDLICSPPATNLGLLVPKNSDLPSQILSWYNIVRQPSWALDGKVWVTNSN